MNVQSNIAEKQQKFIIPIDEKTAKIVSADDRKIIVDAYLKLFYGFAWVNWANKYSLGRAWQTSLGQCGAFVQTKNKQNPATKYLNNVFESHKKYWSRVIMTHNSSENKISADDKKIKQLREYGALMIRQAMDSINLVLGRYNARAEQMITKAQMQNKVQAQAQSAPQSVMQPQEQNMVLAVKPQEQIQATPQVQAQAVPQPQKQAQVKPQHVAQTHPAVQAKPVMRPVAKPALKPQPRPVVQPQKPALPQAAAKKENFVAAQQRIEVRAAQIKLTIQQKQLRIIALNNSNQRAA